MDLLVLLLDYSQQLLLLVQQSLLLLLHLDDLHEHSVLQLLCPACLCRGGEEESEGQCSPRHATHRTHAPIQCLWS